MNTYNIQFLVIARVLYDKGYTEFIEAAKIIKSNHPEINFCWLGPLDSHNPDNVSIETIKNDEKNGFIKYLGETTNVKDYIKKSDCIVLPSYHEGLSRVLMEALAMGKPIITSDIPGCRETVKNGINGFLIKPKDSSSLVEAINKFISLSQAEKIRMGEEARKYAEERFDIKDVIKIYEKIIYNEI